jgi:hypothetical protein
MKRKDYEKPTTQVVQLQQHGILMTSTNASMNDTWTEEYI